MATNARFWAANAASSERNAPASPMTVGVMVTDIVTLPRASWHVERIAAPPRAEGTDARSGRRLGCQDPSSAGFSSASGPSSAGHHEDGLRASGGLFLHQAVRPALGRADPARPWRRVEACRLPYVRLRDDVLRLAGDFTVPFDNQAERIRTYLSTAVKHHHNAIDALTDLFTGRPWTPATSP